MKKSEYKERMFELLSEDIDYLGFNEKMNFVSNIIIEFERKMKTHVIHQIKEKVGRMKN
ncbi:MAG: hypothetical protein Q4E07_04780 [Eubacteriales bacterium]|nr:hypothetical protein [Eubacteriales bacterium]